MQKILIILA